MDSFIESPPFPVDISCWASGGPKFNTTIVELASGFEQRNINWKQARAEYSFTEALRTTGPRFSMDEFLNFYNAMMGRARGFRFKDPRDFQATINNGILNTGTGNGGPTYQLYKSYAYGTANYNRMIKKPVVNMVSIYRNSVLVANGSGAGYISSIDYTKGLVTFSPDTSINITSITASSNPIVTTASNHNLSVGKKIYLKNLNAGNTLNNTIATVSGILTATTFIISNANLANITTGVIETYPQNTETLKWSGNFDVACRFDMDDLKDEMVTGGLISLTNLKVVEIRT